MTSCACGLYDTCRYACTFSELRNYKDLESELNSVFYNNRVPAIATEPIKKLVMRAIQN